MKNFILICFILLSTHIWSSESARVDINDDNEYGNYYEPDQEQRERDFESPRLPDQMDRAFEKESDDYIEDSYDQDYGDDSQDY